MSLLPLEEEQINEASCLNLVVNAIILWNTVCMQAIIEQLRNEGYQINDDDLRHLGPARHEHIRMGTIRSTSSRSYSEKDYGHFATPNSNSDFQVRRFFRNYYRKVNLRQIVQFKLTEKLK